MAKVYVSSTFIDLQDCRRQVSLVLRRMEFEDVAMEYYVAGSQRPVEKCLADVAASDLYVGIFAWRYGFTPKQNNRKKLSITEMEYRHAIEKGKPCLIFLLDEEASWPVKFIDDNKTRIKKLRAALADAHVVSYFRSAEDIGSVVAPAIHNWAKEHGHISPTMLFPEFDLTAYFAALTKRYQRLDLDALTPPQKEEYLRLQLRSVFVEQTVRENPPPVELTKELWEKLQHEKEIHPEDLPADITLDDVLRARATYYEKPSRPVLDALTDPRHQHAIILGDPGSGKSTLSRYVLLSLISDSGDEKLRRAFEGYLPLLIELRSYTGLCAEGKCDTFLEFLDYMGETEGWHLNKDALHHYLKTDGRAVVIFDGLDEIFEPRERERVARRIAGFASDYPKARVIVTSRVIGYRRKVLEDAGFAHFTLQDLDEQQVSAFVDRWYSLASNDRPDEARDRRERIMRSFKESVSIRQLAGNPMLLTIMAIIGKHQELPRERWKLYDHAASVLIQHWDVNKHLQDQSVNVDLIEEEDKKELLRRLAYRMQGGAGGLAGNYIYREQLQEEFESYLKERYGQPPAEAATVARAMIEQFRERNFILSLYGANVYGFVHRAFLEYFCATAFKNKFEKTQEMTLEEIKHDVYGAHLKDRSWHEVLRLICGMIDERFAGEIIDYLTIATPESQSQPWHIALAIQCLSEVRNLSTIADSAKRLLEAVCLLFSSEMEREFPEAYAFLKEPIVASIEMIGPNWPHRILLAEWLKQLKFNPDFLWLYIESFGNFVGSVGHGLDEVRQVILNYAVYNDPDYRMMALFALAKGWRTDPQVFSLMLDHAANDESEDVRRTVVDALSEHFHDEAQAYSMLLDRAVNDESNVVRSAAAYALSEHFRDEKQVFPLLLACAVNDKSEDVRSSAVEALSEDFHDEAQVLPLLLDRAVNDESEDVRRTVVDALSEHFHDEAQVLSLLLNHAANDKSEDVRSSAVEGLGEYFRDDARTFPLLLDYAVNDESPQADAPNDRFYVREAAISALATYWPSHPEVLSLLRDRAKNDPTGWLREEAKNWIDQLSSEASTPAS